MSIEDKKISVDINQLCDLIKLLNPSMDDYLYVYDFVNDFYFISPHATERFSVPGYAFHDVVRSHEYFVYPPDLPMLQKELNELLTTPRNEHNMHYRWLSKDGMPLWINCRGQVVRDSQGHALCLVGCINETGKQQQADNASGLLGTRSLQTFLLEHSPSICHGFFLRIGLDHFKSINARLGVEYGDKILRMTANAISENLLPHQKVYRIFNDEFLILDLSDASESSGKQLYNQTRLAVEAYIVSTNYESVFTISGGLIMLHDIEDISFSNIMKLSEFALDEAKHQGRNRCYVFKENDYKTFLRRRELMLHLRQAVNHNFEGFEPYFQAVINPETEKLTGAETLLRFHLPDGTLISPDEFIPILEETGLIIPVGRWVLEQAFHACTSFINYLPTFRIGINISPIQILKSYIGSDIISVIDAYGLPPSQVVVELTESNLLESDSRFQNTWALLKSHGVTIALDDFGSGYSNFRYLTELSPDIIKLDRLFTSKALENPFEFKLLSLFSEMAHALNLKVCAEGVETKKELDKILQAHPNYIQGFYFSRPCPYEQFLELLSKQHPQKRNQ